MNKSVILNGKQYDGVAELELTTADGGEAVFVDQDDVIVPAGDLAITANGTYDAAAYASVTVNVPTEGETVVINNDTSTSITLAHNTEYRRGEAAELVLALPEAVPEAFECQVSFTSGETATALIMPEGVTMTGDAVSGGVFTPKAHYRYGLIFWYDGDLVWCVVCAAALEGAEEEEPDTGGGDSTTQDGTETNPYMISTAEELKALADEVDGGDTKSGVYYALSTDIDLSGYASWDPIGAKNKTSTDINTGFAGVLDGRGHVLKNLNVSGVQYAGLFGSFFDGTLMNLGIESGNIETTVSSSTCGAIARKAVSISSSSNSSAKIVNCYSKVPTKAAARSAGLVDELATGAMVVGCYQAAAVGGGSGYAIKAASTTTGDIHYCLWNKTLTINGYTTTTNATNNSGIATAEFASAHETLNSNLAAVASKAGIDVSKLCAWEAGSDGYPRLVVKSA